MAQRSINQDLGLFGPDSMIWRINRETVVALGGACAILMQLAHPKVAAGVRDHSTFESDPAGRLRRTFDLTLAWVFGERGEALQAARVVNRRHDAVQGADYSARDPELLMWVQATLVYSAISAYRSFVGPLTSDEADGYYQDTKRIGVLLGIPAGVYPGDLTAFEAYMESMLTSGEIRVEADALRMAWVVLQPHFPGIPQMAFAPLKTITAGLLPQALREQYRLPWGKADRRIFAGAGILLPRILPVLPPRLRFLPPAQRAYRRLALRTA